MSKRNFILLVVGLLIIFSGILGYWYLAAQKTPAIPEETPSFLSKFNPFKPNPLPSPSTPNTTLPDEGDTTQGSASPYTVLTKISSAPVAGYGIFNKERLITLDALPEATTPVSKTPLAPKTEIVPAFRFIDRATGNIFESFADKIDVRQFSNTSIPKVHEAFLGNNGGSVIMRYLKSDNDTIETFLGTLPKEVLGGDYSTPHEVTGSFLPEDIKDLSISPDGAHVFYILPSSDGVMGITLDLATNKKVQIFQNAYTEWTPGWGGNKIITLTTKPAASVMGYMYVLDPITKSFTRVLGGTAGLTASVGIDNKTILYSDNTLTLFVFYMDTGGSSNTGLHTLPEKCVWGTLKIYCAVPKNIPVGEYPDSWYQGTASFNDQIWSIDINAGTTTLVLDPSTMPGGEVVDATKLGLDPKENYLFFVNKIDSSLWEYKLNK
jgi:hypothetical protein